MGTCGFDWAKGQANVISEVELLGVEISCHCLSEVIYLNMKETKAAMCAMLLGEIASLRAKATRT